MLLKLFPKIQFTNLESLSLKPPDLYPVPSSVDHPHVSVKGKLNSSFHHWQSLGATQFILIVIRCGYKIQFIFTPPSRGITRTLRQLLMKQNLLGRLSWSFCVTIVSKKYFRFKTHFYKQKFKCETFAKNYFVLI